MLEAAWRELRTHGAGGDADHQPGRGGPVVKDGVPHPPCRRPGAGHAERPDHRVSAAAAGGEAGDKDEALKPDSLGLRWRSTTPPAISTGWPPTRPGRTHRSPGPRRLRRASDVIIALINPVPAFPHDHRPFQRRTLTLSDGSKTPYLAMLRWIALATACGLPGPLRFRVGQTPGPPPEAGCRSGRSRSGRAAPMRAPSASPRRSRNAWAALSRRRRSSRRPRKLALLN